MAVQSHYIDHRSSRIHYLRMGTGKEWLFCFHGYGESAASFIPLEPLLGNRFTMIAFDMPFHGETVWEEGLLFTPEELVALIHEVKPAPMPMHLLGYSMGGRIAMQLALLIPGEIRQLALVAPDGLHRNRWQWLATQTKVGNRLFAWFMRHPGAILGMVSAASWAGLYPKALNKFIRHYLGNAAQREILYKRWTTMRPFNPSRVALRETLVQHRLPVQMLFGRYDAVILAKHGDSFARGSEGLVVTRSLHAGHQLLKPKYLGEIAKMIL